MRAPPRHLVSLAALAGALCALRPLRTVQAAPPDAGESAAASPPASPPASATVAGYAWPAEITPEPAEDDWAGATALETVTTGPAIWGNGIPGVACAQRAIGSWLRVTCTPPHAADDDLVGVLWALAGDVDRVKVRFSLAAELARYKDLPADSRNDLLRKMGASATITVPVAPGSALLLRLDRMGWDDGYEGSSVFSSGGVVVDASWAIGEARPTILYR